MRKSRAVLLLGVLSIGLPGALHAQAGCVYQDGFDPAAGAGWQVETDNNDAGTPAWAVGAEPASQSPQNSFITDATGFDQKDDRLIAPPQDITASSTLIFWHKFFLEPGFDGGVLEVSTDAGATWVDVTAGGGTFITGQYNDSISTDFDSRIAGRNAWTGVSDSYPDAMDQVEVNIGAFAGPARLFRWRFVGDPGNELSGALPGDRWAIDDVEFTAVEGCGGSEPPEDDPRILLHFHGNTHDSGNETSCTGNGSADTIGCGGPFLTPSGELDAAPAARWSIDSAVLSNGVERSEVDPNWVWNLTEPVTVSGLTTIRWWASCNSTCIQFGGEWDISLWADGSLVVDAVEVTATPETAEVPSRVAAQLDLPEITASERIVLVIDARFADTGQGARFYYDSTSPCPGVPAGLCDSTVTFNDLPPEPPGPESICVAPGLTILQDATGDTTNGQSAHDVERLSVSQPYTGEGGAFLVAFNIKMAGLGTPPPSSIWNVSFDDSAAIQRGVRMRTDEVGAVFFESFLARTTGANDRRDGIVVQAGSEKPAHGDSAYDAGSGLITIVVPASDIGINSPGDLLRDFVIRIAQQVVTPAGTAFFYPDSAADDFVRAGEVATVPLNFCAPNAAPTASLVADKVSGAVPLDVEFTVTGTDPEGGDLVNYTLDFGDGFRVEDEPFSGQVATVSHVYENGGVFAAKLTVTDDTGRQSTNEAEVAISVAGPPLARAGDDITVVEGEAVNLDGSGSGDGNAGGLTFAWSQQSGGTVALSGNDTAVASFTAPEVCEEGSLAFQLAVTNAAGTDTDDVVVTVKNINGPPVANAGPNREVAQGEKVQLNGNSSSDPDSCQTLSYEWVQVSGPVVTLAAANSPTPSFTAPTIRESTFLRFRLAVADPEGSTSFSDVLVTVNAVPVGVTKVGGLPPLGLVLLGLFGALARRRLRWTSRG